MRVCEGAVDIGRVSRLRTLANMWCFNLPAPAVSLPQHASPEGGSPGVFRENARFEYSGYSGGVFSWVRK